MNTNLLKGLTLVFGLMSPGVTEAQENNLCDGKVHIHFTCVRPGNPVASFNQCSPITQEGMGFMARDQETWERYSDQLRDWIDEFESRMLTEQDKESYQNDFSEGDFAFSAPGTYCPTPA